MDSIHIVIQVRKAPHFSSSAQSTTFPAGVTKRQFFFLSLGFFVSLHASLTLSSFDKLGGTQELHYLI